MVILNEFTLNSVSYLRYFPVSRPYHFFSIQGARNINPIPYFAECFGHKLHMDQNEKLAMFGITHVLAIDGYSGKIVGSTSMPVKNNLLIYTKMCTGECLISFYLHELPVVLVT